MAGHSKWAQIKRKKALVDAKKGKVFSKIAKTIELAAQKGDDPNFNSALRDAIEVAKSVNMPKANIDRAVAKGVGKESSPARLEELYYEAYGPGGAALLIKAVTNNRNRTAAEIKHALGTTGGSLAGEGSVAWQFKEKGFLYFPLTFSPETVEELAINLGAEDVIRDEEGVTVIALTPKDLHELKKGFESFGYRPQETGFRWYPINTVAVKGNDQEALLSLLEKLEELEDVQEVFTNFF